MPYPGAAVDLNGWAGIVRQEHLEVVWFPWRDGARASGHTLGCRL